MGSIKYTHEGFLQHWHDAHTDQEALEAPGENARAVRCGHYFFRDLEARTFTEPRRHAEEAHCHVRGSPAYAPVARVVTSVLYADAETGSYSLTENENSEDYDDPPSDY